MSIKKVGDFSSSSLSLGRTGKTVSTAEQDEASRKVQSTGGAGDTVSLSDTGKLKAQALSTAMSTPEVRTERVASLRNQVESGTYRPDATRTATAMVKDGLNLYS